MGFFAKRKSLGDRYFPPSREELIRRSRLAVIDDEKPEIIEDLTAAGYAVDHFGDVTKQNIHALAPGRYDVVLLDFAGVGRDFGDDQGLSLLQYIRRTNPAVVIVAYTATGLGTRHADFFRQADLVLSKDAGIAESTEKVDEAIRKALITDNLWHALLQKWEIGAGSSRDAQLQDLLIRCLDRRQDKPTVRQRLFNAVGSAATDQLAGTILEKLIDLLA